MSKENEVKEIKESNEISFDSALKVLKEDGVVRRISWPNGVFLMFGVINLPTGQYLESFKFVNGKYVIYEITLEDLIAKDWQIIPLKKKEVEKTEKTEKTEETLKDKAIAEKPKK